jgi:hypothetical protein
VLYSIVTHILPTRQVSPRKARRLVNQKATTDMAESEPLSGPPEPSPAIIKDKPAPKRATRRASPA